MSENASVSAWLRGIIDECGVSGTRSCAAIAEAFGIDCKHERTCRDCITKMMTDVADRIDAERALPEGVEWPRFEDGELVRIGDELEFEGKTMLVCDATFYADGWALWCDREDMSGRLSGSYGERVKRPAPKVLDADGVPIKVGDTVYFVGGSRSAYTVEKVNVGSGRATVDIANVIRGFRLHNANPAEMTHESLDSWRLWGEDLAMAVKVGELDKVEMMRRAKALAKAASEARGVE